MAASPTEQSSSGAAAAAVLESNASLLSVLGARHNFLVMTSILDEWHICIVCRDGLGCCKGKNCFVGDVSFS